MAAPEAAEALAAESEAQAQAAAAGPAAQLGALAAVVAAPERPDSAKMVVPTPRAASLDRVVLSRQAGLGRPAGLFELFVSLVSPDEAAHFAARLPQVRYSS